MSPANSGVRLFISHSSRDSEFASLFVDLLKTALNMPSSQIRCTSVEGYRLPVGAKTDEQIRQDILTADVFLGLVSPESLRSLYVVFELGARWGADRPLYPILLPGTDPDVIREPLKGLNAINAGMCGDLHQLVSTLSKELDVPTEEPSAYVNKIEAIAKIEAPQSVETQTDRTDRTSQQLSREAMASESAVRNEDE